MLTRLRVQGFKNLLDIDIRFGPFTCIAGPNGVGKSNVFDAIRFLHLLAKHPIAEAVQLLRESRGRSPEPGTLLTAFGSYRAAEIRLTADLVIDRKAEDELGIATEASISSVRYSVAFRLNGQEKPERLELREESLVPVGRERARKELGFEKSRQFVDSIFQGRRTVAFLSTHMVDGKPLIRIHQERRGGRHIPAPKSSRTVLGGLASSDFPTLFAVRREMESWQTLLLEPSAMRAPAYYTDPRYIDNRGAYVPAAIERLRKGETRQGQTYAMIENRLSDLIEDVQEVRVIDDERTGTLTLEVSQGKGIFHPARSLSDGTLRFLVLATLAIDSSATGLICLEEPENGIHPERIPAMVELLRDIACDPDYPVDKDNPMRQVVINTHSPKVVSACFEHAEDIFFMDHKTVIRGDSEGLLATILLLPDTWRPQLSEKPVLLAPGHIHPYSTTLKLPRQLMADFSQIDG